MQYSPKPKKSELLRLALNPEDNFVKITDERDSLELARRKANGMCQPPREELYSCNPDFNGVYSDNKKY